MSPLLRAVILWLHLLAVMIWMSGLVFQVLVVFPVFGRGPLTAERLRFSLGLEARFRAIMWPAIGLVLFTGLVNLMNVWQATSVAGVTLPTAFVRTLSIKFFLVLGMLTLQAAQQWLVQPRRLAALRALPPQQSALPPTLLKWQRLTLALYSTLLGLAAGVVGCAVLLRTV